MMDRSGGNGVHHVAQIALFLCRSILAQAVGYPGSMTNTRESWNAESQGDEQTRRLCQVPEFQSSPAGFIKPSVL